MAFPFLGELASLAAALGWATSICLYRGFGTGLPAPTLNLFKNTIALACIAVTLLVLRPALPTSPALWGPLAVSGALGIAIGDTASFVTLEHLGPHASATALCLAPPLIAVFAFLFLKESLSLYQLLGIALCLVGVLGTLYFNHGDRKARALAPAKVPLIAWFCIGLAPTAHAVGVVLARKVMPQIDVFWGTTFRLVAAIVLLYVVQKGLGQKVSLRSFQPGRRRMGMLALAAFFGTYLGLCLLSVGVKYSKAGVSGAISSTYQIWVIPIASLFLGEKASWKTIFCVAAAVGGMALMLV